MSSRVVSGIIIALLLLLSGYLWYQNTQLKQANTKQVSDMVEMQKVQEELDADYQAALESIEGLRSDNTELNALIDNQKEELKAQKKKIDGLIWTRRELDKARDEIAQFETLTGQYLAQISELKAQTEQLTAQNTALQSENSTLSENLSIEKDANTKLQEARAVLVSEKESLAANNKDLAAKVEIGSAISVSNITFTGGTIRDDGTIRRRKINKRIKVLRTCFQTEANGVVQPGDEIFYLRIIGPTGETLASDDRGSGILTDKKTGQQVRYTMSGTLSYNNDMTEACMDWTPQEVPGDEDHKIEIYNKGYKVGEAVLRP